MSSNKHFSTWRQGGFTLVELMVSLALGLVVLAATYTAYMAASSTSGASRAVAQLTEDASVAMSILRNHVVAAGYSRPVGATGTTFTKAAGTAPDNWVKGCDANFADLTQAITALTCGTTGSDSLAVEYEADLQNSVLSSGVPLDCVGNALTATGGANSYYPSYSRFYISNNALYCYGSGGTAGQPLVENLQSMNIKYGLKAAATGPTSVVIYKNAADVAAGDWPLVIAVRVCLIMRSADEVLDSATAYQGCDPFATATTPSDRRVYRAFTSTFVIKNRTTV